MLYTHVAYRQDYSTWREMRAWGTMEDNRYTDRRAGGCNRAGHGRALFGRIDVDDVLDGGGERAEPLAQERRVDALAGQRVEREPAEDQLQRGTAVAAASLPMCSCVVS